MYIKIFQIFFGKTVQVKTSKGFLRFGCAMIVIGILTLVLAFYSYENEESFEKSSKQATGTVINLLETVSNTSNNSSYTPVVKFMVDGRDYTFTSNTGSYPPAYQTGQQVEVIYDPQNPTDANINDWSSKWLGSIISAGLGVFFILFGAVFIIFRDKIKPDDSMNTVTLPMLDQQNIQL